MEERKAAIFVHESSYIDEECEIGEGTKIWHFSHIMSKSKIGNDCNIGQNVFVSSGVILGNNVKVQNNVSIYTGVICEDNVFLGPSCVFTNVTNPRSLINRKNEYKATLIKEGASVGANATIICGHTVGKFALIGAGSVITKDVKDYELIIGNPGKRIGWVCQCGERIAVNNGEAACKACNTKYILEKENLKLVDNKGNLQNETTVAR